jgi:hypothetical protein
LLSCVSPSKPAAATKSAMISMRIISLSLSSVSLACHIISFAERAE